MSDDLTKVSKWYSSERSYEYMPEGHNKGFKIWENDVVLKYFSTNTHILNIGCGMGREAFYLYDMGFKITAVDISKQIITEARRIAFETKREIDFILTNGLDLPLENDCFEIIIIWSQTFGLLYGEGNKTHVLRDCYRVLKKGGFISFSGHNKEFIERNHPEYVLDGKKFFAYADTDCYWELFTINEMKGLAAKTGFEVIDTLRHHFERI
jgi:ubiquinone/menaquinone biosynthesis C-methylase UbiE